jgi:TonB family protein
MPPCRPGKRELREKRQYLGPPKLASHDRDLLCASTVDLKDILREIETDDGNLFHGTAPLLVVRKQPTIFLPAEAGPFHIINIADTRIARHNRLYWQEYRIEWNAYFYQLDFSRSKCRSKRSARWSKKSRNSQWSSKFCRLSQRSPKKGWEGVAAFTIKVDVDGKPYDCKITESSGHDVLDKETCRYIIMRARFKPAIDSNGKPYVSDFSSKLRWKIPH